MKSNERREAQRLRSDSRAEARHVSADRRSEAIAAALRALSLDDLRDWAGEAILNRGKRYVSHVDQLALAADGDLVAWVRGSHRYATTVRVGGKGGLTCSCTCPFALGPCKHAVAVLLSAAEHVRNKRAIPMLEEDGDLAQALAQLSGMAEAVGDEWNGGADDEPVALRSQRPGKAQTEIRKLVASKSHGELLQMLIDLSNRFPEVRQHIVEKEQIAIGQVGGLVRALRTEIVQLTAETAWYDHWRNQGSLPDYSHIEEKLRELAGCGHADAVIQLGGELWTRGSAQVEQADDEGETAMAIGVCLQAVMAALPQSSLSPPQQLLWVIDRLLEDEYGLLDGAQNFLEKRNYGRSHWQDVAGVLERRLQTTPTSRKADFYDRYRRQRLLNVLLDAYERAGWNDKIVPRLEAEAEASQCYLRLVDEVVQLGDFERARRWCVKGYTLTVEGAAGIAAALQERLRAIAEKDRRYDLVAAYRADDFFESPSVARYEDLRKAAKKAKCWPAVQAAALHFLETGKYPDSRGRHGKSDRWPLPPLEVERPTTTGRAGYRRFPDLPTLIDIAIAEKRLDDAVHLYQGHRGGNHWGSETDRRVAQAVSGTHPDLALGIWQRIVDSLIARTKPKAYEEAAVYLRFMKRVYTETQRLDDWQSLLSRLRAVHKAKRRFVEVLDNLSGKKLV